MRQISNETLKRLTELHEFLNTLADKNDANAVKEALEAITPEAEDDLISKKAVVNILYNYHVDIGSEIAVKCIEDLVPIPCGHVRTGFSVPGACIGDGYTCSECGTNYRIYPIVYNFCPHCGSANDEVNVTETDDDDEPEVDVYETEM